MPTFVIGRNYGYVGTRETEVIEAANREEAEDIAESWALQTVEWWVEEVEDDDGGEDAK